MPTRTHQSPYEFRIWEKIEIQVGSGPHAGQYLARVQDIINGGIVITEPEYTGGGELLREGTDVSVTVTREDAVYEFQSHVKRLSSGKQNQVLLTPPTQLSRVQRRRFVRVELIRRVSYAMVSPELDWSRFPQHLIWRNSQTVDLSGGGVRFRVDDPFIESTLLLIKLELPEHLNMPMAMFATVKRCYHHDYQIYCGTEFLTGEQLPAYLPGKVVAMLPQELKRFDAAAQNRLVNYVFNLQIDLRRKGLL